MVVKSGFHVYDFALTGQNRTLCTAAVSLFFLCTEIFNIVTSLFETVFASTVCLDMFLFFNLRGLWTNFTLVGPRNCLQTRNKDYFQHFSIFSIPVVSRMGPIAPLLLLVDYFEE